MAIIRPPAFPRWSELAGNQGVPGANELVPVASKQDTGWIPGEEPPAQYMNWYNRIVYDWLQYLDSLTPGLVLLEGFENATFPPVTPINSWATPSPRYPTDLVWVRSTTGPLAGAASASAPTPQAINTNSSLGLTLFLFSASRIQFVFDVKSNINSSDLLNFYIDGVLVFQMSSITGPTEVAGTWVSDIIREGKHTFDWRFIRGATTSVAGEKCLLDSVQILPESFLATDPLRFYLNDIANYSGPVTIGGATPIAAARTMMGPWTFDTGTNVGQITPDGQTTAFTNGIGKNGIKLLTALTGATDFARMLLSPDTSWTIAKIPIVEWRVGSQVLTANNAVEAGLGDFASLSGVCGFSGWTIDGSVSTTAWKCRTRVQGGATTDIDPNIAFAINTMYRLGTIMSLVGGISSAVFMKDGKSLAGTGGVPPISVTNISPLSTSPLVQGRSVNAAALTQLNIEGCRFISLR